MKLRRRLFLHLAAGAAALPLLSQIAKAQTYPTKPVRIIVGFAAGGVFSRTSVPASMRGTLCALVDDLLPMSANATSALSEQSPPV
jgi:hypothetical protein